MRPSALIGKAVLLLVLASWVGTQVLAWQSHYSPRLGAALTTWGAHHIYRPWDGWQWAWQWYGQAPAAFEPALWTFVVVVGLGVYGIARRWYQQREGAP